MRSITIVPLCVFYLIGFCRGFFPELKHNIQSIPYRSKGDEGEPLFLTPLLEKGMFEAAQEMAKVTPDVGNVSSYSGYFTVNEECESNLFFWFFPATQANWKELPLLLWLQGGPGVSSMYGLFVENGPFKVTTQGLEEREYSWNRNINVIYIDQPVGAGFSFTAKNCYPKNGTAVGEDLYRAIVQFHQLFPNFANCSFFISGQSYAGHYIPALGHIIHKNNPTAEVKINLKTMMIGNGWSDPVTQNNYGSLLYEIGLIDQSQKNKFDSTYKKFLHEVAEEDWHRAHSSTMDLLDNLYKKYVGNDVNIYNFLPDNDHHLDYWYYFLLSSKIHKALHVGNKTFDFINHQTHSNLQDDRVQSVKVWVEELLEHYPIVFYNGQLDIICAYPMTTEFLRSLRWSGQDKYLEANRTKWCVDGEQAGYLKGQHNLYDVLVRGAGHAVPADQPRWAFELINSIVSGPPNDPFHLLKDKCWFRV